MGKLLEMNQQKKAEQAISGLQYLFDMPDDLFATVYPTMKEEFISSIKNGSFEQEVFSAGITSEEKEAVLSDFIATRAEMERDGVSREKLDFFDLIIEAVDGFIKELPYRNSVKVQIQKCHSDAVIPTYANPSDAGCDVYAIEDTTILPLETKIIPTGLKVAIPSGWMISVRPRSGMSVKTPIRVANAPGTIDSEYRDEVGIILHNTNPTIPYTISKGDRIAQFVIEEAPMIRFEEIDDITKVEGNRNGGFGHTGQ